ETMLLHRILEALATGQPLGAVLRLVTQMVEVPPLHIEVAVLYDPDEDGGFTSQSSQSASPAMVDALARTDPDLPWNQLLAAESIDRDLVGLTMVPDLPASVRASLDAEGYLE